MIFWIFFCDTHTHAHKEMNFINISTLSPGHRDALTLVSLKAFSLMTSLFMWAGSEAEGGRAVKVKKVKGEEAGVLQNLTHTHAYHAWKTHTHMQTAALCGRVGMRACVYTPTRANYRVNSCSLTSRCCQYDWGEERRRSKESGEREERGGKDGATAAVYICS